jgi:hypothetical protein
METDRTCIVDRQDRQDKTDRTCIATDRTDRDRQDRVSRGVRPRVSRRSDNVKGQGQTTYKDTHCAETYKDTHCAEVAAAR